MGDKLGCLHATLYGLRGANLGDREFTVVTVE